MTAPAASLKTLGFLAVAFYASTWAALFVTGIRPVVPWTLLLSLVVVVLPVASLVGAGVRAMEGACDRWPWWRVSLPFAMAGLVFGWELVLFVAGDIRLGLVLLAAVVIAAVRLRAVRQGLVAGVTLLVFFAGVWHANYAALWVARHRLLDPIGRATDVFIYAAAGLDVQRYSGVYPLVSGPLFTVLEQGYMFLLPELMLVVLLVAHDTEGPAVLPRLVAAVASCYVAGVVAYLLLPLSGPCLFYPESISPSIAGTMTYQGMQQSRIEFESVRATGRAVTGFAYFVALPSLHAALATLMQLVASRRRWRGLIVLPINVAATMATFLLGWHYVIDILPGMALGVVAYATMIGVPLRDARRPDDV